MSDEITNQREQARSKEKTKKRGRPARHTPEINRAIKQLISELPSVERPGEVGLTIAEFARLLGVDQPVVYRWVTAGDPGKEAGNGPDLWNIKMIEDKLGVLPGEILTRAGWFRRQITIPDVIRGYDGLDQEEKDAVVDYFLEARERTLDKRANGSSKSASTDAKVIDAS